MRLKVALLNFFRPEDPEARARRLRAEGLLVDQTYAASRAFEVEMYEDEGRHLFLEVSDGVVLYLTGQFLFDYGIDLRQGNLAGPQTFPCTDFTLVSHRTEGYVYAIDCRGDQLAPEELFPPYQPKEWEDGAAPGCELKVIRSHTYDQLFAAQGRLA